MQDTLLEDVNLSDGSVRVRIQINDEYYYKMLSQMSGIHMESEYELINTMKELAAMKEQYVKVQSALEAVRGSGYVGGTGRGRTHCFHSLCRCA